MLTARWVLAILLAAVMVALAAGAREMSMGKSKVKIGDSGEMEFKRTMANGSVDAHPVKIKMDELVQVDANGNALTDCQEPTDTTKPGMSWMNKPAKKAAMKGEMKAFTGFNNQQFAFESKLTDQAMKHGGSMKAEKQKFSASLGDGIGKMTIDLALPEEDGDIDIAGEKQRLKKGDMKFNIEMSEWNWCDNAAFLDVYMKVQGKNKPKKRFDRSSTLPASYDMGDNKTVSFSGKFQKDAGDWTDMAAGYPKVDPNDDSRVIVRFPRFTDTLIYDPTVSGDEDDDSSDASGLSVSAILITMATAATYVMLK